MIGLYRDTDRKPIYSEPLLYSYMRKTFPLMNEVNNKLVYELDGSVYELFIGFTGHCPRLEY